MKKEYKKYSQPERVFRLRMAAPNDTICLSRAIVHYRAVAIPLRLIVGRFLNQFN